MCMSRDILYGVLLIHATGIKGECIKVGETGVINNGRTYKLEALYMN